MSHTQIHKYKYTNTQIKHMTKYQKDPTCCIFLKRGLFKDIKNDISINQTCKYKNTNTQIHKYTNTAYDKVPESPNMLYILEHGSLVCKFWHKFNLICLSSKFLVICLFLHFYKAFLICVFSHFIVFKSNFAKLSYLFFSFPFHIFTFFISYP